MVEIRIGKNDGGQRLDKFLTKALPDLPPSLLYKAIRTKKIKVNRKRAEGKQMLVEGDLLQVFLPPQFLGGRDTAAEGSRLSAPVSLQVLYEDDRILLVYKPKGIPVHEDDSGTARHLLAQVQAYLYQKGDYDPLDEQSFAPSLCNRIDRGTEGIVICAKTAEALRVMDEKIRARELDKRYLCIVHGTPHPRQALLQGWLLKDEKQSKVRVFDKNPPPGAKTIRTKYSVLATKDGLSLLEVELLTGRTHQIRAHLSHIGHPLLGDGKYGKNSSDRARGYACQALCAYQLRFCFDTAKATPLDDLNGLCVSVPTEQISFLREFPEYRAGEVTE